MTREEATEQLRQAIEAHGNAYGNIPAESMLSEFAVVAHWVPIVHDGTEGYSMHYATDNLPQHVALGLMQVGVDVISSPSGDDED